MSYYNILVIKYLDTYCKGMSNPNKHWNGAFCENS